MPRRLTILTLLLVVAIISLAIYLIPFDRLIDAEEILAAIQSVSDHWWAPLAYLGVYMVLTLVLVPPFFLSAAAALMWGWVGGGVVELIAATLAAIPPYLLGRWGGGERFRRKLGEGQALVYYDRIQREGFLSVLIFRLVPVIPYVLLNYLAGVTSIRADKYVAATLLGMIPSIFLFTYWVDAMAASASDWRAAVPRVFLAGAAIAALVLLTRFVAARLR